MEAVVFAVRQTPAALLQTLREIARDFDESPRELCCVLGPAGAGVQWLTFRATAWAKGQSLAAGFFVDGFALAKVDFVVWQRDGAALSVASYKRGKLALHLHSDGKEMLVTTGALGAKVYRVGDAESIALAATDVPGPVPWRELTAKSSRVALRQAGKLVAKPRIASDGGALPRVRVVPPSDSMSFASWREIAKKVFPIAAAPARTASPTPKVLNTSIEVGASDEWIDLAGHDVVSGQVRIDDSDEDDASLDLVVDLAQVRVWRSGSLLMFSKQVRAVVGTELRSACDLHISGRARIELPALQSLRHGKFDLRWGNAVLELPELREVKTLEITCPKGPVTIRLPKLAKGNVEFSMLLGEQLDRSTLALPLLAASQITVEPASLRTKVHARVRASR